MKIVEAIQPQLPLRYYAAPRVHLGGAVEIDVGTFKHQNEHATAKESSSNGGSATALWIATAPTLRVETEMPDVDEYEVRVYDQERDERLVAAIELVSPSNKDRPDTRSAFVAKCAALLGQQVAVAIVDVVTSRNFSLYAELLEFMDLSDPTVGDPPAPIYAAVCRGRIPNQHWTFEAWHRPLTIGQPLPQLPVWLADDFAVTLDLESSYEETCRVLRMA
jgi:hypothetical protein